MLRKRFRKPLLVVGLAVVLIALAGAGIVVADPYSLGEERMAPGISVLGQEVGNMTPGQVRELLLPVSRDFAVRELVLTWEGHTWTFTPQEIGVFMDVDEIVQVAFERGNRGNFLEKLIARQELGRRGWEAGIILDYSRDPLQDFLDQVAGEIDQEPLEAQFQVEGEEVLINPSRPGRRLDLEGTGEGILAALQNPHAVMVEAVVEEVEPARTTARLEDMDIDSLVASFSTTFNRADVGRSHNIVQGSEALRGVIIEPGEVFSFNQVVGPRTGEAGYREAPVIVNNRLVPGIGGGICQVSTTLYNAALLANLEVVQRANHSLPVSYVQPGRDATVVYDAIDLRFRNQGETPLLLWSEVDQDTITVQFFGQNKGDRVRIYTRDLETIEPGRKIEEDKSLPAGMEKVLVPGKPGYRVTAVREVTTASGTQYEEVLSRDYYQPQPTHVLVGTGPPQEEVKPVPGREKEEQDGEGDGKQEDGGTAELEEGKTDLTEAGEDREETDTKPDS